MIIQSIFDPVVLLTSFVSASLFGSWFTFWYKNKLLRTTRERAYVCTLLSSSVTSISSLPLVYQLLTNGGNLSEILAYRTWTVIVTTFFMTFLIMDLCIGIVFYKDKIEMLTGWIHHITYLGVLTWAIHNQFSSVFIMMCSLEIPTFILALGSVRSQLRRDYIFATTFLLTRILFHAYAIKCAWVMKPYGPVVNAVAAFFPVHCFWFYGFIQQQIRLAKKRKNDKCTVKSKNNNNVITQQQSVTVVDNGVTKASVVKSTSTIKTTTRKKLYSSSLVNPTSSFHSQSPPVSVH